MRSNETARAVPAARSDGLLIEPIGDETVIYDTESKQAHCLKPLAALVFGCCDGHATLGEIATTVQRRLGDDVGHADVADAVQQLESLGLLQAALVVRAGGRVVATNGPGVSRREMLRRVGFAGAATAVGTSLVTSIVPSNALALSGIPAGCDGCLANKDCVSGHCCQSNSGKTCLRSCCASVNNSCHITICRCSLNTTVDCLSTACPGGAGECICTCSVCASEVGGVCPTCPTGSQTCCSNLNIPCPREVLEPPPTPTPTA